jgi:CheY-like chemotaxis protein/HPt (histidine-containing phosphotransfer) domain-containing protein
VADDHANNLEVAVRILETLGCRADVAHDGRAAVEAVARNRYDVVLMDLNMPGMDGLAATAEIRRREGRGGRHTPIVALTAHAMEEDRTRCLAAGMDDYLAKPIRPAGLREVLRRWSPVPMADVHHDEIIPTDNAAFCWADLVERYGGDPGFARTLAATLLAETPGTLDDIRKAIAARDAERIAHAAHGLRGNCLTIGAGAMGSRLSEVELAGRHNDLDAAQRSLATVEFLWHELSLQLHAGIEYKT